MAEAGIWVWDASYNLVVKPTTYCGRVVATIDINGSVSDSVSITGLAAAALGQQLIARILPATSGLSLSAYGRYVSNDLVPSISVVGDTVSWTVNANTAGKSYRVILMVY